MSRQRPGRSIRASFRTRRFRPSSPRPRALSRSLTAATSSPTRDSLPSLGSEQTADYIARWAREIGLEDIRIEEFPSDGEKFFWAFRTAPWWEARKGELILLDPKTGEARERLASFGIHRIVLGRFSRSASLVAKLVDVGSGLCPEEYEGKDFLAFSPHGPGTQVGV